MQRFAGTRKLFDGLYLGRPGGRFFRIYATGICLLDGNRLGQIAWLIHIRATRARSVVCEQL